MKIIIATAIAVLLATSAVSKVYVVNGHATVQQIDQFYADPAHPFATPGLATGNSLDFSYLFDTAITAPRPDTAGDPTINVYHGAATSFSYRIVVSTFATDIVAGSTIQIWNDHGSLLTDAWTIGAASVGMANGPQFGIGAGTRIVALGFNGFDFTHLLTSSDDINVIPDVQAFGYKSVTLSLEGGDDEYRGLVVTAPVERISISPVPEPSTWFAIVGGLFATGAVLRRRTATAPQTRR